MHLLFRIRRFVFLLLLSFCIFKSTLFICCHIVFCFTKTKQFSFPFVFLRFVFSLLIYSAKMKDTMIETKYLFVYFNFSNRQQRQRNLKMKWKQLMDWEANTNLRNYLLFIIQCSLWFSPANSFALSSADFKMTPK